MPRILIIDDDDARRAAVAAALADAGHDVHAAAVADAPDLIAAPGFDIALTGAPRRATVAPAGPRWCALPGPLTPSAAIAAIANLLDHAQVARRLALAARAAPSPSGLVGTSPAMRAVHAQLAAVAASDAPLLLTGESGTGKELLARAAHAAGPRRDRPFVAIACAAIPDTLFEAELFGFQRGAFTGATAGREGRLKVATGGTLLLDDVDGLSPAAQAKLLRVLADGSYAPLGSDAALTADVRVICTSNRPLDRLVAAGAFRADLYYRLDVLAIAVPPLRARRGDLAPLVRHFLAKHGGRTTPDALAPRAWAALAHHRFPGNVRELEHAIQRGVVMARGGPIDLAHLPPAVVAAAPAAPTAPPLAPLAEAVRDFERVHVARALRQAGGNKAAAARLLGISRKHLWRKLRLLAIDDAPPAPDDAPPPLH